MSEFPEIPDEKLKEKLSHISDEELAKDLMDATNEVNLCEILLWQGVKTLPTRGDIQTIVDKNKRHIHVIRSEQDRRRRENERENKETA